MKLEELMLLGDWSQASLLAECEGRKLRVNRKTLAQAINGGPSTLSTLKKIALALDVDWTALVDKSKHDDVARLVKRRVQDGTSSSTSSVPPAAPYSTVPPAEVSRISRISQLRAAPEPPISLSVEDLLQELAQRAVEAVSATACSIFMWDEDVELHILRESTTLSPFIGRSSLDLTQENLGITATCAADGRPYLCRNVHEDPNWSSYGSETDLSDKVHCELPAEKLGSMIVVPILAPREAERVARSEISRWTGPLGVLRVVRTIDEQPFREKDVTELQRLADDYRVTLWESQSFARLMDVALTLDVSEMCRRASDLLAHLAHAKGCSIFVLDDLRPDPKGQLTYRSLGTTGLHIRDPKRRSQSLLDASNGGYRVPADSSRRLTAFIAQQKRNVVIDDLNRFDFKGELGIDRPKGPGKVSELFREDRSKASGPYIAAPLFFRERRDPDFPAMGVVRASRPEGSKPFAPAEQRRFFALADRLGRAILRSRYHELLETISFAPLAPSIDAVLEKVVAEVARLLGGRGCSVLVGSPKLAMKATFGQLEATFKAGGIPSYDVADETTRGITGAAVAYGRSLHYNSLQERAELEREGIVGSSRNLCEIEENPPGRLAIAPILCGENCIGAIRMPKSSKQMPFSNDDISLLSTIGRHLGVAIEKSS